MSQTIIRVLFDKSTVSPDMLPVLAERVRNLLKGEVFKQLRQYNDGYAKFLSKDPRKLSDVELAARLLIPDYRSWENPPDEILRQVAEDEEYEEAGVAWKYSVKEESACVSGTLKLVISGFKITTVNSSIPLEGIDEFQFSIDIFDDEGQLVQSLKTGKAFNTQELEPKKDSHSAETTPTQQLDYQEEVRNLTATVGRLLADVSELKSENIRLKKDMSQMRDRINMKVEISLPTSKKDAFPDPWGGLREF